MPLPDWLKPEELWEKVMHEVETPDPEEVRVASKQMENAVDNCIHALAAEPGGIFTLLQEAVLVTVVEKKEKSKTTSELRHLMMEEGPALADLSRILKHQGFSAAYHYARTLHQKNPHSQLMMILLAYCSLGAPVNPETTLKIMAQLESFHPSGAISSLIRFLKALAQQKLGELSLALGSLVKVVEMTRQGNFDRLRVTAADLIVALDEIRLGVRGLQIEPLLEEPPAQSVALAAKQWFQKLSQQNVKTKMMVRDLIFGLSTLRAPENRKQPVLLMSPPMIEESCLRSFSVRRQLYFSIVDIPELNSAVKNLICRRGKPRERLIFSSLPREYIGRLVFFTIVEAAEIKGRLLESKLQKLAAQGELFNIDELNNDFDDDIAGSLFEGSEIINEPDRLIYAHQTEIQADIDGAGRLEIVVTKEMEQYYLLNPRYVAVLVFR